MRVGSSLLRAQIATLAFLARRKTDVSRGTLRFDISRDPFGWGATGMAAGMGRLQAPARFVLSSLTICRPAVFILRVRFI